LETYKNNQNNQAHEKKEKHKEALKVQ